MKSGSIASSKNPIHVLVVATSLNPNSRSQVLAQEMVKKLLAKEIASTFIDLRESSLPFAGPNESWSHPEVQRLKQISAKASHFLFVVPIYNFDVNAAAKNFIELMGGEVMEGKTVGFLCVAGGHGSFASVLSFANSLMLDFRCWIVPRFVYISGDFKGAEIKPELHSRMDQLVHELIYHVPPPAYPKNES